MNNKSLIAGLLIIIIGGVIWYFYDQNATQGAVQNADLSGEVYDMGAYAYECDEHVTFTMTPSRSMASIKIAPTTAGASYPPTTVVWKMGEGNHYESDSLVFTARGETVTLGEGDSAINCSPVPSQTEAPFNFGD